MKSTLFCLIFVIMAPFLGANQAEQQRQERVDQLQKPLYNPFVENYILNELKTLRDENRNLKIDLHETLAKKELAVSSKAIDYATSTINNMFYIIAAASTILVFIGWSSFRETNEKIKITVDEQITKLIAENETRMQTMEQDLAKRSRQVLQNQEEIARTNTIHSLWMRANLEATPSGKIEIYDQILNMRPDDAEALTYKADAALDMGEANWALSLCNQAIAIDSEYPNALYQRACAYSALGYADNAIDDLEKALELNEHYADEIENEKEFDEIKKLERFSSVMEKYTRSEEKTISS